MAVAGGGETAVAEGAEVQEVGAVVVVLALETVVEAGAGLGSAAAVTIVTGKRRDKTLKACMTTAWMEGLELSGVEGLYPVIASLDNGDPAVRN